MEAYNLTVTLILLVSGALLALLSFLAGVYVASRLLGASAGLFPRMPWSRAAEPEPLPPVQSEAPEHVPPNWYPEEPDRPGTPGDRPDDWEPA